MAFYDLTKTQRLNLVEEIRTNIQQEVETKILSLVIQYFSSEDTYIRKSAYLSCGRIYFANDFLKPKIISTLNILLQYDDFKIRQTAINAAGEIGKIDFEIVKSFFDEGLLDKHHSARNAVIGCIKKMGEVNPTPVVNWARQYLHHPDKEIRREICHGIELRGRKYPQDILPLLEELQFDKTARVRNTLVHVIGQIAYKKGCLATVISSLNKWENKVLVKDALAEIIDVHFRYRNFSALTQEQAKQYIDIHYI
ncbi:HEAT repeat domain-containing protein [Pedobacter frigiditerrae]|uniref:HEAT repeat domain-containing protein n=1 Tax=Pedobacter frigiditerrae TaxID=2530452 RepID=UPI00292E4815|nr:HEAT repeat domain-containing protein [Pedobacter frigiditerrae]